MDYIILAIAFYCIILNCMAITMVTTLKRSKQADRGQIATVTMADKVNIEGVNMNCCETCGESFAVHNGDGSCIDDRELEIENQLLSDYHSYRDIIMELKSLPPGIEHVDGDIDNSEVTNLKADDYELATSGMDAGKAYAYDKSITWEANIKLWQERIPVEYPEGYEQGIVIFQDGKPIYKSTDRDSKHGFKKLIKFEKVKKVRKSKVRV